MVISGAGVVRAARLEMLLGDPWLDGGVHSLCALAAGGPPVATLELLRLAGTAGECVSAAQGGQFTTAEEYVRALRPVLRRDVALGYAVGVAPLSTPQSAVPYGVPQSGVVYGVPQSGVADVLCRPGARGVLTAAVVSAAAGTVLRAAVGVVAARGGAAVRQWQGVLAALFAELLACECLTGVALRALGRPGGAPVLGALTGYLVPHLIGEGLEDLELVLNENGCAASSAQRRTLDKVWGDLPGVGAGPADTARRLARLVSCLPALADAAVRGERAVDGALFRLGEQNAPAGTSALPHPATPPVTPAPRARAVSPPVTTPARHPLPPAGPVHSAGPVRPAGLVHSASPADPAGSVHSVEAVEAVEPVGVVGADGVLFAVLGGAAARLAGAVGEGEVALGRVARRLVSEQRVLLGPCRTAAAAAAGTATAAGMGGVGGVDPVGCGLAERQALLGLAGAVLGVREAAVGGGGGFLAGAGWAVVALSRITERLGVPLLSVVPAGAVESVWVELAARVGQGRDVDVYATPLPW
ncbi:hypothetical protein [Streptomyces sp. NPDC005485]|uniref:hypothetical protein n=1 Tax=Streptomyces sp. NPDC005485 TaxID=3155591 RepID=UPI0033AA344A